MAAPHAESSNALYLVIDQGGQSSRAMVFDRTGNLLVKEAAPVTTDRPRPDWVEHRPAQLMGSVETVIEHALSSIGNRARDIAAAGLATQRSSVVCWERSTGQALTPVLSWQDRRAKDWLAGFESAARRVHQLTGLVLSPHYGASKLRWCLDEVEEVADAHARGTLAWGPLASYIVTKLLKEQPHLIDPANASRTLIWDYRTRDWSPELLQLFGLPVEPLPECTPSRHAFGHLKARASIPLAAVTGDQSAAVFAFGIPEPGTAFINMGTGAFLQCVTGNEPVVDSQGLLSSVVWQDASEAVYVLEGTVNGAASALKTVGRQLGVTPSTMIAEAPGWLERAEDPPLFLNGVSGLGSPYWLADFPSEFLGEADVWEKMVAIYESIVFLLAINLDAVQNAGISPTRIMISGGLANVDGLCQRLADLSGLVVRRPLATEATARGLAYLTAGTPEEWDHGAGAAQFCPRKRPRLAGRFSRWRRALEERISRLAGNGGSH